MRLSSDPAFLWPTPRPTPIGFGLIDLVVRDHAHSHAFYTTVLGLTPVSIGGADAALHAPALVGTRGLAGGALALIVEPTAPQGRPGLGGVHHLAFATATPATLLRWKRWLQQHGVAVSGPLDRKWFASIYFRDPDGQILEIATRGTGYTVDEPAGTLGQRVIVPGAGHLIGQRDEAQIAQATAPEPVLAIDPPMALDGLHHVTGMAADLPGLDHWLATHAGLRLVKQSLNQDDPDTPHWFWAASDGFIVLPGTSVTLFGWPAEAPRWRPGAGHVQRIRFVVEPPTAASAPPLMPGFTLALTWAESP